jgi:hypothetical protein
MKCKHAGYRQIATKASTKTIQAVLSHAFYPDSKPSSKTILNQELRKRELGT